jgi:hypothetical protein
MQEVTKRHDQADENARRLIRQTKRVTRRKFTPEGTDSNRGDSGGDNRKCVVQARGDKHWSLLQVVERLYGGGEVEVEGRHDTGCE